MRLDRRCVVVDLRIGGWSPVGMDTKSFWARGCKDGIEDAKMGLRMRSCTLQIGSWNEHKSGHFGPPFLANFERLCKNLLLTNYRQNYIQSLVYRRDKYSLSYWLLMQQVLRIASPKLHPHFSWWKFQGQPAQVQALGFDGKTFAGEGKACLVQFCPSNCPLIRTPGAILSWGRWPRVSWATTRKSDFK